MLVAGSNTTVEFAAWVKSSPRILTDGKNMTLLFALKKTPATTVNAPPSPRQLYDEAAADTDYSKKACIRSLASRTVILAGRPNGLIPMPFLGVESTGRDTKGFLSRLSRSLRRWGSPICSTKQPPDHLDAEADSGTFSYAVASVTHAEPGEWEGKNAHFIRLHVEYHPDSEHYLQRIQFTIRVWKAGDALRSIQPISHMQLLSFGPPDAPEFGNDAPEIVFYSPRAVVGRPAGSTEEPYWEGHFQPGEHFVFYAEAMPPTDYESGGPLESTQPRSLLHIAAFGDAQEQRPAPHFDVSLVVVSAGKPFDLTASSTSTHWGLPAIQRYLFTPYRPARFTRATKLIPKGEKRIGMDFGKPEMRDKVKSMMGWASPYDTVRPIYLEASNRADRKIWFGCPNGCVDKPATIGRNCGSDLCKTCEESRHMFNNLQTAAMSR